VATPASAENWISLGHYTWIDLDSVWRHPQIEAVAFRQVNCSLELVPPPNGQCDQGAMHDIDCRDRCRVESGTGVLISVLPEDHGLIQYFCSRR
jgi:hypothetical protein